jgi:hypothetical protein
MESGRACPALCVTQAVILATVLGLPNTLENPLFALREADFFVNC